MDIEHETFKLLQRHSITEILKALANNFEESAVEASRDCDTKSKLDFENVAATLRIMADGIGVLIKD